MGDPVTGRRLVRVLQSGRSGGNVGGTMVDKSVPSSRRDLRISAGFFIVCTERKGDSGNENGVCIGLYPAGACPELAEHRAGTPLYARRLPFLRQIVTIGFSMEGCIFWQELMDRAAADSFSSHPFRAERMNAMQVVLSVTAAKGKKSYPLKKSCFFSG